MSTVHENRRIILTGGGTAGHVTPNLALVPALLEAGFDISYIGSYNGMEKELVTAHHIPYYGISSGKLRRYFSVQNFTDPFRVLKGFAEANTLIKKLKPALIFSKGGFVTVPVVLAGRKNKVPVILHESDMTPGLANRICMSSATKICCNFPETLPHLPTNKGVLTGSPIRTELLQGNADAARALCGFSQNKPVMLVMGGSLGAAAVNDAIRRCLPSLLPDFQIVHLCGKGKLDETLKTMAGYRQFEYVHEEMKDLLAMADIVVSRAGANAIYELLALKKPHLLIPLSAAASRGDQILNANSFKKQGFSVVMEEESLSDDLLVSAVHELYKNRETYTSAMEQATQQEAIAKICDLIRELSKR